jgi:hypothetical protein
MLAALEAGVEAVAIGVDADARPLPLAVRVEPARALASRLLERGDRSLRVLVAGLETRVLAEADWRVLDPDADTLRDVDRLEDLRAATTAIGRSDRRLR